MYKYFQLLDVGEFSYEYVLDFLDDVKDLLRNFLVQLIMIKVLPVLVEQDVLHVHIHRIVYVYSIKFDRYLVIYIAKLVMLFH